jgi:hypothetical protein
MASVECLQEAVRALVAERQALHDRDAGRGAGRKLAVRWRTAAIEKRCLLNRMLQGAGIVPGLRVVATKQGTVTVAPGFALDPYGREIL